MGSTTKVKIGKTFSNNANSSTRGPFNNTQPSSNPPQRVKAVDPGRLTKFIDSNQYSGGGSQGVGSSHDDSGEGGGYGGAFFGGGGNKSNSNNNNNNVSALLNADRPPSVYDPSLSWDGLSLDPRPFSRFDARPTRIAPGSSAPVGLAGNRVIELDYLNDGTAFGLPTYGSKVRVIPPTFEQLDTVLRYQEGYDALIMDEPSFKNFNLNMPTTAPAKTPSCLIRGGPQADRCLLNPSERREIMEFEHKSMAAHKMVVKADAAKNRLLHLMKTKHATGCVGVDSVKNLSSEVYGDLGSTLLRKTQEKQVRSHRRREQLTYVGGAVERLGYNPFHHNEQVLVS